MKPAPLEANKSSTRKEISCISFSQKVHCWVQKRSSVFHRPILYKCVATDPYSKSKLIELLLLTFNFFLLYEFHDRVSMSIQYPLSFSQLHLFLERSFVSSGFATKPLYAFHLSCKSATFPTNLILLYYGYVNSSSVL